MTHHAQSSAPTLLKSSVLTVPHCFSTRVGGISRGIFSSLNFGNPADLPTQERDPASNIAANFARVTDSLNISNRRILQVHQVHGADVHIVGATSPRLAQDPKADAIVTTDHRSIAVVRVADCTPILLQSADGAIVAAVHAGWRGVLAGVLPATIDAMLAQGATNLRACIGPCISAAHFEVGPEVLTEFARVFGSRSETWSPYPAEKSSEGKGTVNLQAALAHQLRAADVQFDVIARCTFAEPELFFSHRRDAGRTGRMIGLISPK